MAKVELKSQAPDFQQRNFQGKEVSLSDYRDLKNVLLVFNRGFA